jgi:hypothetical protein
MKYIEELHAGTTFTKNSQLFLLTVDFKKNNSRLAYSLSDGSPFWFSASEIVIENPLYQVDERNNVVPIKPIYNTPSHFS